MRDHPEMSERLGSVEIVDGIARLAVNGRLLVESREKKNRRGESSAP